MHILNKEAFGSSVFQFCFQSDFHILNDLVPFFFYVHIDGLSNCLLDWV